MKIMRRSSLAIATAAALAAQPVAAQQAQCVSQQDLAQAAIYAMPLVHTAYVAKCSNQANRDGFLAREGEGFIARYAGLQDQSWPAMSRVMMQLGASKTGGMDIGALVNSMPESALRPFLDAILREKIAEGITPGTCAAIDRAAELLAPLPPENVGGIVALMLDLAKVDDPPICPYSRP